MAARCSRSCYTIRKKHTCPVHCGPSRGPPRHSAEPGHHARQAQRLWRQGRARTRHVDRLLCLRLERSRKRSSTVRAPQLERRRRPMFFMQYGHAPVPVCSECPYCIGFNAMPACQAVEQEQSNARRRAPRACGAARWSGTRVVGATMGGAGMMPQLSPVPLGRCRGPWRERQHRTVPSAASIGFRFRYRDVPH